MTNQIKCAVWSRANPLHVVHVAMRSNVTVFVAPEYSSSNVTLSICIRKSIVVQITSLHDKLEIHFDVFAFVIAKSWNYK